MYKDWSTLCSFKLENERTLEALLKDIHTTSVLSFPYIIANEKSVFQSLILKAFNICTWEHEMRKYTQSWSHSCVACVYLCHILCETFVVNTHVVIPILHVSKDHCEGLGRSHWFDVKCVTGDFSTLSKAKTKISPVSCLPTDPNF